MNKVIDFEGKGIEGLQPRFRRNAWRQRLLRPMPTKSRGSAFTGHRPRFLGKYPMVLVDMGADYNAKPTPATATKACTSAGRFATIRVRP